MALTSVKLVDGSREMILLPRMSAGVRLTGIDVPFPAVREVAEDRTDDYGTRDTTTFFGARAASVELLVTKNPRSVEDELSRFMHPRLRPFLVVDDDEWPGPRRLGLRSEQFAAPMTVDLPQHFRRIQAQWKVPSGIWEADTSVVQTISADIATTDGRTYPKSYPWSYPTTLASGATIVGNLGSIPSHFSVKLYGPCTGPRLINGATGEEITFTSALSLSAGEYVEVDTRERTALALSTAGASRLGYLDFAATSWWRIEPGDNPIRYVPATAEAGAAAVITYRPAWL
jgi:hypothetical protein